MRNCNFFLIEPFKWSLLLDVFCTAAMDGPDSRRTGSLYAAYIKCDPGARAFCKCASVDALPAIVMLLPAASSVLAQKHAL